MKRQVILSATLLTALIFIFGCATATQVKVRPAAATNEQQRATFQDLVTNSDKYNIHVYEWNNKPAAAIFDPKDDDKVIRVSEQWKKIAGKAELQNAIDRSQFLKMHLLPALYTIAGPDGKTWAYIASYATNLNVKYMDAQTMTVFAPDPPPTGGGY